MDRKHPVSQAAGADCSTSVGTFRDEHRLVVGCICLHFVVCGIIAARTDTTLFWLAVGVPALVLPIWLVVKYPVALLSRLAVSASAMTFVVLGVQQTGGYMEAHFSFFVMITIIAVYRDWRLLIFGSALIIIHHIGFTILNPIAVGFYVQNDAFGAWRHVLSHLSVGLMQVFALCYLTILLRKNEAMTAALGNSLDRAQARASRDQLTGLFNRNHLEEMVAGLSPRVEDGSVSAVVNVLDIDLFKNVNDRYGHAVGDEVLRAVAAIIQSQVRPGDMAIRQGGEEFLILLQNSNIEDAFHFAERIRNIVASHPVCFSGSTIRVTLSGGIAVWRQGETFDETFKRADEVLYLAKEKGRNRIEFSPERKAWEVTETPSVSGATPQIIAA